MKQLWNQKEKGRIKLVFGFLRKFISYSSIVKKYVNPVDRLVIV